MTEKNSAPGTSAIRLGVVLILVGLAFNVYMALVHGWPTLFWVWLMGLGFMIVLLGFWARSGLLSRMPGVSWLHRHADGAGLFLLVAFFTTLYAFTGVKRREVHQMSWQYVQESQTSAKDIRLTFVKFPKRSILVYHRDLGAYLESLKSREVAVTWTPEYNFGKATSFQEIQIGPYKMFWREAGASGGPVRDPWH